MIRPWNYVSGVGEQENIGLIGCAKMDYRRSRLRCNANCAAVDYEILKLERCNVVKCVSGVRSINRANLAVWLL